jgi:hypothetical protein
MATYNKAKAGQPGIWTIADPAGNFAGDVQQATGVVRIRPTVPCYFLRTVIFHEAQHVKQGLIYGITNKDPWTTHDAYLAEVAALAPYGGIEVNADCAAWYLLGSEFVVGGERSYIHAPCTGEQLRAAIATANGHRV